MSWLVTVVIMPGRQPASQLQTDSSSSKYNSCLVASGGDGTLLATGWLSVECDARARSAFRVAEDQESSARQEHLSFSNPID